MNQRITFITLACSIAFACSETPYSGNIPWKTTATPDLSGNIIESHALSDKLGNINLIWQQLEQQIPTKDSDATSVDDTQYKCSRTNLFFQTFNASTQTWGETQTLQKGVWRAIEKKEFVKDSTGAETTEFTWQYINDSIALQTRVATDSNGNLTAAWLQDTALDDSNNEISALSADTAAYCLGKTDTIPGIYTAAYSISTWTTPLRLIPTPDNQIKELDLALNSDGKAIIAWSEWDSDNFTSAIYGSHFDGVETWSTATKISGDDADSPRATLNDNDSGTVAWLQLDSGTNTVKSRSYSATDNQWANSIIDISSSSNNITELQLAMDDSDISWIAWAETSVTTTDSQGDIYVNSLAADGTVGTASNIQEDLESTTIDEKNQHAFAPQISVDASSNVTVAWLQRHEKSTLENKWNTTGNYGLWVNRLENNSWTGAENLVNEASVSVVSARIIETSNKTILAWTQNNSPLDEKEQSIYNRNYTNGAWSESDAISEISGEITSFAISSANSTPVTTWVSKEDDTSGTIYTIGTAISK